MAPEEIKNTVVRFGGLVDRGPPFALDGRDVAAVGMTDRVFRHGARVGRRDERLGLRPRATLGNFRALEKK